MDKGDTNMMTKKDFIALADMIKTNNLSPFDAYQILALADFCKAQNPNFNKERWICYIKGECGLGGGKVK